MKSADPKIETNRIRFLYWFMRGFVYWVFRILWRLEINGAENIPPTGTLIAACNHRSNADPQLMGISIKRAVHFLAKAELYGFPLFAWVLKQLNAHPLNRAGDVSALRLALNILENDGVLIVFPEGTRSKTDQFRKPKPGVGMLAKKTGAKIIPVYIHNSAFLSSFKKITVTFGVPEDVNRYESYEEVAQAAMESIGRVRDEFLKTHS